MYELSVTRFRCCTKCGCTKPMTREFFALNGQNRYGFDVRCKSCKNATNKAWYARNRERHLANGKAWYSANLEYVRAYHREYYEVNKEQYNARAKAYYTTNRERVRAYSSAWYQANKERLQPTRSAWYQKNKIKERPLAAVRRRKRMALIRNAEGEHTFDEIWQMYGDQDGLCAYCEIPLFGTFDVDHMQPISRGGRNDWTNLAIACPTCNRAKRDKTTEEFIEYRRLLCQT